VRERPLFRHGNGDFSLRDHFFVLNLGPSIAEALLEMQTSTSHGGQARKGRKQENGGEWKKNNSSDKRV